jgi:hypothetical protein
VLFRAFRGKEVIHQSHFAVAGKLFHTEATEGTERFRLVKVALRTGDTFFHHEGHEEHEGLVRSIS